MSDAASLASCLMAGLSAGLATLAFGPAALIWRRRRRRFALTAPLLAAILLAGSYAGLSGSLSDSLLFALACGAGAAAGCMAPRTKTAAKTAASAATASTIRRTAFMSDPKTLLRTRRQQASEPIILKAALMLGDQRINYPV